MLTDIFLSYFLKLIIDELKNTEKENGRIGKAFLSKVACICKN